MPTTCSTCYLGSPSIRVRKAINCSRKTLKESRPATARIEFGAWLIKWGSTACTVVYSFFVKLVIFPSASRLSSFLAKNAKLFRREDSSPFFLRFLNGSWCRWGSHANVYKNCSRRSGSLVSFLERWTSNKSMRIWRNLHRLLTENFLTRKWIWTGSFPDFFKMVLQNDIDLLNPPAELEKRKHKLKRLVQSPNSFFMDVKCQGCFNITTVFSHSQTVVVCGNCQTVLCQPTGGRARLTEGCSFRRKGDWWCGSLFLFAGKKLQSLFWSWVYLFFLYGIRLDYAVSPK